MSLDATIREALDAAAREVFPALLAELGQRARLISIDELPVSPRLVKAAARRGEIKIYVKGRFRAVDEHEFFTWVKRGSSAKPAPKDEADELIELAHERRRHAGGAR